MIGLSSPVRGRPKWTAMPGAGARRTPRSEINGSGDLRDAGDGVNGQNMSARTLSDRPDPTGRLPPDAIWHYE
jgi:hypothetical protein